MSSVIAIDLGNENCVIAVPRKGGVDIIKNQSSNRLTPTMVAFDETRRYAGAHAQTQQMQNVVGTITNIKRLTGLKYADPEREVIEELVSVHLVELENGYIGIELPYRGETRVFLVEQCICLLIAECFRIAKASGIHADSCVIVVSPWWTEVQRRVLLDAASLLGIKVMKLLNSTTAVAIAYSIFQGVRLPDEESEAVPVALIDFGDASMNVAIAELKRRNLTIKSFTCDQHLGGSYFTTALQNYLLPKVIKKYNIDPRDSPRAMLRFRTAVEKTKKILSINTITQLEIPCLMNVVDVSIEVKREEFESIVMDLVGRINSPIQEALNLAGVDKDSLFAIEVHGGASRAPIVRQQITEILGKPPTQTLNPDECFALGGGFQAALLSPQFSVKLNVRDVCSHPVMIDYVDIEGQPNTKVLFNKFHAAPATISISIRTTRQMTARIYSEQNEIGVLNLDTQIDDPVKVKVMVRITGDSLVEVSSASYIIKEEKEEEDGTKKTYKKEISVKCSFEISSGLKEDRLKELQNAEKEMNKQDALEEMVDNTKNELESYIFRIQNGITRDFPNCFDPEKKDEHLQQINDIQMWFSENEFDRLPLNEYQKRLLELKLFGEPAIRRRDLLDSLEQEFRNYEKQAQDMLTKVDTTENLTEEEKQPLRDLLSIFQTWLDENKTEIAANPLSDDLPSKKSDAKKRFDDINSKIGEAMAKKPDEEGEKATPPSPPEEDKPL